MEIKKENLTARKESGSVYREAKASVSDPKSEPPHVSFDCNDSFTHLSSRDKNKVPLDPQSNHDLNNSLDAVSGPSQPYQKKQKSSQSERATFTRPFQSEPVSCSSFPQSSKLSHLRCMLMRYVQPLLDSSLQADFTQIKMEELPEKLKVSSEIRHLEVQLNHVLRERSSSRYIVLHAILKLHWKRYAAFIGAKLMLSLCEMLKPLIITKLTFYIANMQYKGSEFSTSQAYQVAVGYIVFEVVTNLLWENLLFTVTQSVHISENALKTVLLKKHFTISHATCSSKFGSDDIYSLIERDTHAVWVLLGQLPDSLSILFELTVSLLFVYHYVGVCALVALLLFSITIALNIYATSYKTEYAADIQSCENLRIQQLNEAISNAKLYKLYGWICNFCGLIKSEYRDEMKKKQWLLKFDFVVNAFQDLISKLTPILVFFVFGCFDDHSVTMPVIMLTSVMLSKAKARFQQVTQFVSYSSQMLASLEKLNEFVKCSDMQHGVTIQLNKSKDESNSIEIKGSFSWGLDLPTNQTSCQLSDKAFYDEKVCLAQFLILKNIDIQIERAQFVCIVGGKSSGKTSFLTQILGQMVHIPQKEIDFVGGINQLITKTELLALKESLFEHPIDKKDAPIKFRGDITFMKETPWFQNGTIRQNILFGQEFDKKRYVRACMVCKLEDDFLSLANGDQTKIGDLGLDLDAGQKARISLARALYSRPDIVLMDNPFDASCIDQSDLKVFHQVLLTSLQGKTRVLVTNHCEILKKCDRIIVMNQGNVVADGNYSDLKTNPQFKEVMCKKQILEERRTHLAASQNQKVQKNATDLVKSLRFQLPQTSFGPQKLRSIADVMRANISTQVLGDNHLLSDSNMNAQNELQMLVSQKFPNHNAPIQRQELQRSKKTKSPRPSQDFSETLAQADLQGRRNSRGAQLGNTTDSIDSRFKQIGDRAAGHAFYKRDYSMKKAISAGDNYFALNRQGRCRVVEQLKRQFSQKIPQNLDLGASLDFPSETGEGKKLSVVELTYEEIDKKIMLWQGVEDENSKKATRCSKAQCDYLKEKEKEKQVKISMSTFWHVYTKVGGIRTIATVVAAQFTLHYVDVYTTIIKGEWAEIDNQKNFVGFVMATLYLVFFFLVSFAVEVTIQVGLAHKIKQLSKRVHDDVIGRILHASYYVFFDVTSVSFILSAYERDIDTFNSGLLQSLRLMMKLVSWAITISIFVSAVSIKCLICFLSISCIIVYYARVFLRMNRSMSQLNSGENVPSLTDALNGRDVLQAFKQGNKFIARSQKLMDNQTLQFIVYQSTLSWFNIRVFQLSKLISLASIVLCIQMKGTLSNTALYMIIAYTMNLQWISSLVTVFGQLEQQILQIEILSQINEIPQEKQDGIYVENWPNQGKIEFKDVTAKSEQDDYKRSITGISFASDSQTFLGICGEHGAGSGMFLNVLTRLIELESGQIMIDGVDIATVALDELRSKITVILRETDLIQGTLRKNLDPFGEYEQSWLENAINRSGLTSLLTGQDVGSCDCYTVVESEGEEEEEDENSNQEGLACMLDFQIEEKGQNLSLGERQLVCLIRAMLRDSKIILIDEAPGVIDEEAEAMIEHVLEQEFRGKATVITLTRRFSSILAQDRLIYIRDGLLTEQGTLQELQENPLSDFNTYLYELQGRETEERESDLATDTEQKNN